MNRKKILFVTTRSPFSSVFSGDRQRSKSIIDELNKKNNLEVLYSDTLRNKGNTKIKNFFFERNLLDSLKAILICLIKFKPLQLGYFYSKKIDIFIKANHEKYDTIIFHLIRAAQYLPKDFMGKRILEMTDLMSKNYDQVVKSFSVFNPLLYIYFLEKQLVKRYENYCEEYFDKIILASKNDIENRNIKYSNKFVEVPNTVKLQKNIYNYKNSNHKILFIGNLNYIPNKVACKKFAKKILPQLNKIYSNIEFHIVGEVSKMDKIYFNSIKKTYVHGPVKKLDKIIKSSICGICNVEIATGTQMKMLTYMSYGIPCVASYLSHKNTFFSKGKEVLVYKNNAEFLKLIRKLKEDKNLSIRLSKAAYFSFKKKYNTKKVFSVYNKIISSY